MVEFLLINRFDWVKVNFSIWFPVDCMKIERIKEILLKGGNIRVFFS